MAPVGVAALAVMFLMAGHPERLHAWLLKARGVAAGASARGRRRFRETFAEGLRWCGARAVARGAGVVDGAVAAIAPASGRCRAFGIAMPFTGAWLMLAPLVVGVAVPTPGGVGGSTRRFGWARRRSSGPTTTRRWAPAIVLHAVFVPVIMLGLWFIVQDGLNLGGMRAVSVRRPEGSRGAMKCPYCGHLGDKVVDSRESREGDVIRRRRQCLNDSAQALHQLRADRRDSRTWW